MVRSMTGFGKATCGNGSDTVTIEVSSVNHRYLDTTFRLPVEWSSLEPVLRDALKERLSRGKVNITVSRKRALGESGKIRLDREVAQQYIDVAEELGELLDTDEPISIQTLAQFDKVFSYEAEAEDLDQANVMLKRLLGEALGQLDVMRETEGDSLGRDLLHRVEQLRRSVSSIEERLPELNEMYAERLRARIQDLGRDAGMLEDRIGLEVAMMAERGDVTEEVVRLKSHLDHAEELIGSSEPVGRKLNFLSQEVQREINTLGAKVRDTEVVHEVLEMKSELERIREQIQNIE